MFEGPFRNHPLSILSNLEQGLTVVLAGAVFNYNVLKDLFFALREHRLQEALSQMSEFALTTVTALFVLILIYIAYTIRRWQKQTFLLTEQTLIIEDNRLKKQRQIIHRKDISNINLNQRPFDRFLNLCRLSIDTNTFTTAEVTDVTIVLKKNDAQALKQRLQEKHIDASTPEHQKEKYPWWKAGHRDLFMHMFMSISWFSLGMSITFFFWAVSAMAILLFSGEMPGWAPFDDVKNHWMLVFPLIGFMTPIAVSTLGVLIRMYGFRVRRLPNELELSYGLLTTRSYHLPVHKINAVVIKQNLFGRLFGYMHVEAVNIGLKDNKEESSQILLTAPISVIRKQLNLMLPEYTLPEKLTRQPRAALRPIILAHLLWLMPILIVAWLVLPGWWKIFLLPIIIFSLLHIWFRWRTPALHISQEEFVIVSGSFDREIALLRQKHIEKVTIARPFMARGSGLSTLQVQVLAPLLSGTYESGYYSHSCWQPLIDQITAMPRK